MLDNCFFAALLIAMLTLASHGAAQTRSGANCADRAEVLDLLVSRYGESPRSIGLAPQNRIVELFASDETGSWTITVTSVDGMTCLIAAGRYFESFPAVAPGEPL